MIIVNEKLLDEYRAPGACEWCGKRCLVREPHHLWAKGRDCGFRYDVRINLISLGSSLTHACDCHCRIHNGEIAWDDLIDRVAKREKVNQDDIQDVMWLLMRLPKSPTENEILEQLQDLNSDSQAVARWTLEEAGVWMKGPA